jgi:hypothetical protein
MSTGLRKPVGKFPRSLAGLASHFANCVLRLYEVPRRPEKGTWFLELVARKGGNEVNHHSIHAAVEIGNNYAEKTERGFKIARAIAASEAFRKYNWIKNVPVRNLSGNLRGMVVSKRWATVFHFAEDVLKPVEKVALLAALAENTAKAHHQIDTILNSTDSWDSKAARLSTQVSSVMIRTVGGAIPAGAHFLATSLEGYCQIAGLAGSQRATNLDQKLKSLDASFSSVFDKVTDGNNMNIFINKYLVIR